MTEWGFNQQRKNEKKELNNFVYLRDNEKRSETTNLMPNILA